MAIGLTAKNIWWNTLNCDYSSGELIPCPGSVGLDAWH